MYVRVPERYGVEYVSLSPVPFRPDAGFIPEESACSCTRMLCGFDVEFVIAPQIDRAV
jgi:hypothetical protein